MRPRDGRAHGCAEQRRGRRTPARREDHRGAHVLGPLRGDRAEVRRVADALLTLLERGVEAD
ncbi:MAG TPA: hypothetical protein VHJ20_20950 [Polyangia bacterium]|nr:hypothetical protein [Polyangia bacterium]